jgi:hypothetical protein
LINNTFSYEFKIQMWPSDMNFCVDKGFSQARGQTSQKLLYVN